MSYYSTGSVAAQRQDPLVGPERSRASSIVSVSAIKITRSDDIPYPTMPKPMRDMDKYYGIYKKWCEMCLFVDKVNDVRRSLKYSTLEKDASVSSLSLASTPIYDPIKAMEDKHRKNQLRQEKRVARKLRKTTPLHCEEVLPILPSFAVENPAPKPAVEYKIEQSSVFENMHPKVYKCRYCGKIRPESESKKHTVCTNRPGLKAACEQELYKGRFKQKSPWSKSFISIDS